MSNYMRVGGLATGLDIDKIVNDLMRVQRMRSERLTQDRTVLEWQRADYRSINTQLKALRDATSAMRLQGTFLAKTVTSSNEALVTATAGGKASEMSLDIEVISLATAATKVSGVLSQDPADKIDSAQSLWSQQAKFADPSFFVGESEGDTFEFTINGKAFTFANTVSLDQIITTVNADSTVGVNLFYDSFTDKLSITTKVTGNNKAGDEIVLGNEPFLANLLQMAGAVETGGENAVLKINGLETERTSNVFTVNGVTVNLKGVTPAGVPVKLEVQRDTEGMFNTIKDWVQKYNETLDVLNKKLKEERYRSFRPLTQEQMNQMTDRQIEQWEERAKSGLLQNDAVIRGELSKIRMAIYGTVAGLDADMNHLSEIGITTGVAAYASGNLVITDDYLSGKLVINEAELRKAINEDPDKVTRLFTNSSSVPEEKGIGFRVYETLGSAIKKLADVAGSDGVLFDQSFIGERIRSMNEQIIREEDRIKMVENRYWRQFTALEKAINQMNVQSAWLNAQLGMGQ